MRADLVEAAKAHEAAEMLVPGSATFTLLPESLVLLCAGLKLSLVTVCETLAEEIDPTRVADQWFYWLFSVELKDYATSAPVAELYRRRLAGDESFKLEWEKAEVVARAAAWGKGPEWSEVPARSAAWAAVAAARAPVSGWAMASTAEAGDKTRMHAQLLALLSHS